MKTYYLQFLGICIISIILQCSSLNSPASNKPPVANFRISPSTGSTFTDFEFDASYCSDNEDRKSLLQVRWDWDNDGDWDTSFDSTKVATHRFETAGKKFIRLEVKDTGNIFSSTVDSVYISIPFVYYMPFDVGNKWTFDVSSYAGDGHIGFDFQGTETWEIISSEEINKSLKMVHIKTNMSGIKYGEPSGSIIDTLNVTDTLTIEIEEGILKLRARESQNSEASYLSWLLEKVVDQSDKILCVYQPLADDLIFEYKKQKFSPGDSYELAYTLKYNIGFTTIYYYQSINSYQTFTLTLVDLKISSI